MRGDLIAIGRDPDCDYTIDDPMVSWRHAEMRRGASGLQVQDLRSLNGTFVNGRRISGLVTLQPGDAVQIGSNAVEILDDCSLQLHDYRGKITLELQHIGVENILAPLSLTVCPSEMVAIMGSSGAGKTTLLNAISGYAQPSDRVFLNGVDLYRNYDSFRGQIGYVPQEDIMHSQLTVRERFSIPHGCVRI